jgi:hypothetical protein
MKTNPAVIQLRAFIAYCEGCTKENTFTLIPYADAVEAGIPFAETFVHEGNEWAVWFAGDCAPDELIALEQAGVIDDADDARQDSTHA